MKIHFILRNILLMTIIALDFRFKQLHLVHLYSRWPISFTCDIVGHGQQKMANYNYITIMDDN